MKKSTKSEVLTSQTEQESCTNFAKPTFTEEIWFTTHVVGKSVLKIQLKNFITQIIVEEIKCSKYVKDLFKFFKKFKFSDSRIGYQISVIRGRLFHPIGACQL
uniref:Uncharacterized protein n=1 Tax=Cacopsylla melanoneura TaxID=428564 RepID=A0A8D8YNK7_9HEMI